MPSGLMIAGAVMLLCFAFSFSAFSKVLVRKSSRSDTAEVALLCLAEP